MLHCDRCGKEVAKFEQIRDEKTMTAGYYRGWTEFMNPGENIICDRCMWADPRYIAVHGEHH